MDPILRGLGKIFGYSLLLAMPLSNRIRKSLIYCDRKACKLNFFHKLEENLRQRIVSALILALVSSVFVILGSWFFILYIVIIGILAIDEWKKLRPNCLIREYAYILFGLLSIIEIHNTSVTLFIWLIFVIAFYDSGAYFFGKKFGRIRLYPKISPGKTLEGLVGGLASVTVMTLIYSIISESNYINILNGLIIAIISQFGDLFESYLKRKANVKDSGDTIPGHGGVLDRLDSMISGSIVLLLIIAFSVNNNLLNF